MIIKPYPHVDINVEDETDVEVFQTAFEPLAKELIFLKSEMGIPFEPVWCETFNVAQKKFGAGTFDVTNKTYFSQAAYFANTIFQNNGAFVCRISPFGIPIPKTQTGKTTPMVLATQAFMILEVYYRPTTIVIPPADPSEIPATPAVPNGVELFWNCRTTFETGETIADIKKIKSRSVPSTGTDKTAWTVLPIVSFLEDTPGAWGNNTGFQLFYNSDFNDPAFVQRPTINSLLLSFAPVQKPSGSTNLVSIFNKYSSKVNNFAIAPDVTNLATQRKISGKELLANNFSGDWALPYSPFFYSSNYAEIGEAIIKYEYPPPADPAAVLPVYTITTGYLINLLSLKDLNNVPYTKAVFYTPSTDPTTPVTTLPTPAQMADGVSHLLAGGLDGSIDDTTIESLIQNWLAVSINPKITDVPRFPFTHITDPGYNILTKKAIIAFQTTRKQVKSIISTQQVTTASFANSPANTTINTIAEDESIGEALRAYALLQRESIIKGTSSCRTTIFMQCGIVNNQLYTDYLPATLWAATKRAQYENRDFINQFPNALPNANVGIFTSVNWTPNNAQEKEMSWNAGLNYFQFYDQKRIHYAAIRSVYPYDSSVLVDDSFTDIIVFTKYKIITCWAIFSGIKLPAAELHQQIENELTESLNAMYNGKVNFTVLAYQNAIEKQLGYVTHVTVNIYDTTSNRVWEVDIVCKPLSALNAQSTGVSTT